MSGMDYREEEQDVLYARLARSLEQEMKIVHDVVSSLKSSGGDIDSVTIKKVQSVIEKYQEQGHLLEPHLEGIIGPLMETIQSVVAKVSNVADVDLTAVKRICSIVHTLMTVCGYKTVVKFFPHQASDLEVTVALLERCYHEVTVSSILKEESTGDWETQCTLLLWLSILVLIPFDMASVDTALTDSGAINENSTEAIPPLVERMIKMCKNFLASPGPVREMAGVLLSRLVCRPDMREALKYFVAWTIESIRNPGDGRGSVFQIPGVVGVLASIFKVGGRDILLEITPSVWPVATQLVNSSTANSSSLLRKLLIKLIQRVGLVHLPPRVASWQYMQTNRSLVQNLISSSGQGVKNVDENCAMEVQKVQNLGHIHVKTAEIIEDDMDVHEITEEVIEQLLCGLRDKITVVRWSAAKGLGRVTGCLSLNLADEVVGSVLELFRPSEGDGAWHGGCLALAELARRGLLVPERLSAVIPVVVKALYYDVRRGPHSVGSHVRDAAAYVTWAFARAYSPELMRSYLKHIAPALITIACYDREVNCRRAAAAAFQECVGRQGDFEHGIDIVNAADYFSLGTRSHAYRIVAVYIAQFEEYRLPLIDYILNSKVSHWEKAIRELAAEAMSLLVKFDPQYFEGPVLDTLVPQTLSADLGQRHGATLATAEIIRALHFCEFQLTREKEQSIAGIVPAIEKARLYRGKGGEIMRVAVSRLIECTAAVRVPLLPKVQKVLLDSIDGNLKHPNADIQSYAVAALKSFVHGYMIPVSAPAVARTSSKYLQILKVDCNPAAHRGAALALGALPFDLLSPVWKDVVDTLSTAISLKGSLAEEDAETRVNAIRGLVAVCETLCSRVTTTQPDFGSPIMVVKRQVMTALFNALDDYAVDNRGDVGSWVREAAMEGLEKCTYILCQPSNSLQKNTIDVDQVICLHNDSSLSGHDELLDEEIVVKVIGGLAKQAVEKIDRVRDVAGRTLQRLLHHPPTPMPHIPHLAELKQIIEEDTTLNWAAPGDSFPRLVQLLRFHEYRSYLLSGLVISIGGLTDSLGKVSATALVDFLNDKQSGGVAKQNGVFRNSNESQHSDWLGRELLKIFTDYMGNDRVVIPTLKTVDILFNRGIFSTSQPPDEKIAMDILALIQREMRGSKDVVKLLTGVSVLNHFTLLKGPARGQSIQQLLDLLFHQYPKVRKFCAEQIYLLLLQIGDELVGNDSVEIAMEAVGDKCWDGQIEGLTTVKDQLYELFHVDPASQIASLVSSKGKVVSQNKTILATDENDNYAALVDSAGY